MTLRLYSYWRSSSSWRVRIGLHLKGLAYEIVPVDLRAGEQDAEAHRRRNPMAQVPVLEADLGGRTVRLAQSMAILEWLDERFPGPALLPGDPEGRARVRMLAEHVNSGIQPFQNAATLRWIREKLPDDRGEWVRHWLGRGLAGLEAAVVDGRPPGRVCHGDLPTLADAYLVPQLYGARRFGVDVSATPVLLGIERACRDLDAFARAEPERQPDAPPPEAR